ncbi:hypothetical protein BJ912DRAFT_979218 [Pholiota molesta]|nr:hypothetical protein BJ912DRAFT_979218 [Pholiota molesta]
MAEMVDCCGCCLLCCACVSVCGRLCLWIPWPGDRRKAKAIEEDEEFARQVELDTFGMSPPAPNGANYTQPAPQDAPIVNSSRRSRSAGAPKDHQSNDGHHRAQSNGHPDAQEPLPPRNSNGRTSQDPNRPTSYEYPAQTVAARDERLEHVRGASSGSPAALYAAQQQQQSAPAPPSPPHEHRRVRSND